MPRSKRRQEKSFRENNPSQFSRGRGGFEETGTDYRHDDEQRRYTERSGEPRYGHQGWRDTAERSTFSEHRDRPDYARESRFGRGEGYQGPSRMGREDWSQGFPQYRESARPSWEPSRERDWRREQEYGPEEWIYSQDEYGQGMSGYEDSEGESSEYRAGPDWFSRSQDPYRREGWGQRGRASGYRLQPGYPGGSLQYRRGTSQTSFAGRGPQGYRRSDDRISEDINEMLTQDPEIDASNITVEVHNGEVTLKGSVSNRQAKRRSEDIAESCSGVKDVQNLLRIRREEESESESRREKGEEKQRSPRIAS